jgi:hypothetical protein
MPRLYSSTAKGEGEKFLVADFHRGAPLDPSVREQWEPPGGTVWFAPRSVVLAGRFRKPERRSRRLQVLLL